MSAVGPYETLSSGRAVAVCSATRVPPVRRSRIARLPSSAASATNARLVRSRRRRFGRTRPVPRPQLGRPPSECRTRRAPGLRRRRTRGPVTRSSGREVRAVSPSRIPEADVFAGGQDAPPVGAEHRLDERSGGRVGQAPGRQPAHDEPRMRTRPLKIRVQGREERPERFLAIVGLATPDPVELAQGVRRKARVDVHGSDRHDALSPLAGVAELSDAVLGGERLLADNEDEVSAPSIESSMSCSHLAAGGMSSQSTQTSRSSPVRNACSSRTKAASLREYDTKTSATTLR